MIWMPVQGNSHIVHGMEPLPKFATPLQLEIWNVCDLDDHDWYIGMDRKTYGQVRETINKSGQFNISDHELIQHLRNHYKEYCRSGPPIEGSGKDTELVGRDHRVPLWYKFQADAPFQIFKCVCFTNLWNHSIKDLPISRYQHIAVQMTMIGVYRMWPRF
ncbi:hypothetical protein LZ554_007297 [Drepanopeziza brunnea f. sp. 'monogermtubi']|nr:hypothetical protein LZ554_007297 [Drepanopeziza brunnea f. sp. 'monogermtubi']